MLIRENTKRPWIVSRLIKPVVRVVGGWFRVFLIIAAAFAIFASGVLLAHSGYLGQVIKPLLTNKLYIPNLLSGYRSIPEKLYIDVKFKNWQKIAHKRDEALFLNKLILTDEDYVPAVVRQRDDTVKVKMRLKGDHVDHLLGDKWSFRFIVKGDHTVMGMKQFSVHHPMTRGFLWEWLFQQALKREGIINLRYKFVDVIVNGRDLGIYALEEHFEKRLIEYNQRKDGPIVRFAEDLFWERFENNSYSDPEQFDVETYQGAEVDAFQTGRFLSDPTLRPEYEVAIELLKKWRDRTLRTSEVFDCELLARMFALSDLFGVEHGLRWHNQRFYYNPITCRLEPIGFDAMAGGLTTTLSFASRLPNDLHMSSFFEDSIFTQQYFIALERFSRPEFIGSLLSEVSEELDSDLSILHREFPSYMFDASNLSTNQTHIRSFLYPESPFQAHFAGYKDGIVQIMLGGIQQIAYNVHGALLGDSLQLELVGEPTIQAKEQRQPVNYFLAEFALPKGFNWQDSLATQISVEYGVPGLVEIHRCAVLPYSPYQATSSIAGLIPTTGNTREFDFVEVNEDERIINIIPGIWTLNRDLILPAGYTVQVSAGTSLDLITGACLISYSPVWMMGTEANPILITASDSTGAGILISNAGARSLIERVNFTNLSNPAKTNWQLTGAVTFYRSPVDINNCFFGDNRCEDALNVIRADFRITGTVFSRTQADAFDGDFATGTISDSRFISCGNDAIDVSGSYLRMDDININGTGDKGISIGENSTADGLRISIEQTEIAVASKDNSRLTLDSLWINGANVGFTAFQKKPEYGPGQIRVTDYSLVGIKVPYLIENNSRLVMDGVQIDCNENEVKNLLYGVKYGKASK